MARFGTRLPYREAAIPRQVKKGQKEEKHITPMSTGDEWVAELGPQLENLRDPKPLEFKAFL